MDLLFILTGLSHQWFNRRLRFINPLGTDGIQSARYVHSCLELAIMIIMSTTTICNTQRSNQLDNPCLTENSRTTDIGRFIQDYIQVVFSMHACIVFQLQLDLQGYLVEYPCHQILEMILIYYISTTHLIHQLLNLILIVILYMCHIYGFYCRLHVEIGNG